MAYRWKRYCQWIGSFPSMIVGAWLVILLPPMLSSAQKKTTPVDPEMQEAATCLGRADELECLERFVDAHPNNLEARKGLGMRLALAHEFRRALRQCDAYLLQEPADLDMRRFRADILEGLGEHAAARDERERVLLMRHQQWDHLLSEDSPNPKALHDAAVVADSRGEWSMARKLYEKYFTAVSNVPTNVLVDYAGLLSSQQEYRAAIEILAKLFDELPAEDYSQRLVVLRKMASTRKAAGDEAGAKADAARYAALMADYKARKKDRAQRRWRLLLEDSTETNPSVIIEAAASAEAADNLDVARKLYERYLELKADPDALAVLGYAEVLRRQKDYSRALSFLLANEGRMVNESAPLKVKYLCLRATLEERLGNTKAARRDWHERDAIRERLKEETLRRAAERATK